MCCCYDGRNQRAYICFRFSDETRISLLQLCLKNLDVDQDLKFGDLSKKLEGYTCSDIINVCR